MSSHQLAPARNVARASDSARMGHANNRAELSHRERRAMTARAIAAQGRHEHDQPSSTPTIAILGTAGDLLSSAHQLDHSGLTHAAQFTRRVLASRPDIRPKYRRWLESLLARVLLLLAALDALADPLAYLFSRRAESTPQTTRTERHGTPGSQPATMPTSPRVTSDQLLTAPNAPNTRGQLLPA